MSGLIELLFVVAVFGWFVHSQFSQLRKDNQGRGEGDAAAKPEDESAPPH